MPGQGRLSSLTAPLKWQIESPGRFYDARDGLVVYFDPASGDTHLLSDFAACIIEQFPHHAISTEQLVSLIEPQTEAGDAAELASAVMGVLEELVALDIVQRA